MHMVKHRTHPTIGLALSGGSTLGIAHIGVLKAFAEHGIPIHHIAGTSAGSLVAALYAFKIPIEYMADISRTMKWKRVARFARSRLGWASNYGIAKLIEQLLGRVQIEDAGIPLSIIATNIETGKKKVFESGSVLEAVRASTSIPGYFTPVEIDGTLYVDGGLSENLPLSPLKDAGVDIVIGVNLASNKHTFRPKDVRHVIKRSVAILTEHRDRDIQNLADIIIEPIIGDVNAKSFDDAEKIFEAGYTAAIAAMPKIENRIAVLTEKRAPFYTKLYRLLKLRRSRGATPKTV